MATVGFSFISSTLLGLDATSRHSKATNLEAMVAQMDPVACVPVSPSGPSPTAQTATRHPAQPPATSATIHSAAYR